MSRYDGSDTYVYPGTEVLQNKADAHTQSALDAFEADVIAVEDFTIGHRTAKASAQQASKETIGQLEFLRHYCRTTPGVMSAQNTPASVKAFVTDKKLRAYNLYDQAPSKHHRDAARHAVYVAIRLGKLSLDQVKDIMQGEKRR